MMKTVVVSYSYTGNNDMLAQQLAQNLNAEHIRLVPCKPVTTFSITLDLLFGRAPAVKPDANVLNNYDFIILTAPVWMGMVAFPMRAYLKALQTAPKPYGFVSLSGGADGINPGLKPDLIKRIGSDPVLLLGMHIKDLLPSEPVPERKDTSAYRVTQDEAKRLAATAAEQVAKAVATLG